MDIHEIRKINLRIARYRESFHRIKKYKEIKEDLSGYCRAAIERYKMGHSRTILFIKERGEYLNSYALNEFEKCLRKERIGAEVRLREYMSEDRMWRFELEFVEYRGGIEWMV